jgi:hypothetical protein
MQLPNILRCAKPLIFEDGPEGFEYSAAGTFFVGKYRERYFAITAKHCLKARDKDCIRLVFDERAGPKTSFVPIIRINFIDEPPEGQADFADIALLEFSNSHLSKHQKAAPWFINIDQEMPRKLTLWEDDILVTRGFPNVLGGIDYDDRKIVFQAFAVDGFYGGKTDERSVHRFRFSNLSTINDLNGMSGAPVFRLEDPPDRNEYRFVGMVVRATRQSGYAHFVDCGPLFWALRELAGEDARLV